MKNRLIVLEDKRNKADEARKNKDRITPDIKSLSKSIGSIAGKISDIKANRMIIESYKNYKKDFEEIVDDYESSYKQSEELKEKLKAIEAPTDKEMVRLSDKVEQLQHDINDSKNTAIQLRGDYQLVSERLDNANTSLGKALEQEKERKRIMRKHNVAQTSLSVLSAFREHLAKEAVPQITDYASDMISSITDGKFISIMINQRYAISVKRNDGNVLDVKMLSGGEKDTVAICLRLAISMMLSGGEPSMIILDEVLTAMDDSRANSILNSIQDSGHGQVIIIAHNDIIRQISDKAVLL
jgi:exonuclease SbcC